MALVRTGIGDKAWIATDDAFLSPDEAEVLQAALRAEVMWERRTNRVDGEDRPQARTVGWAGRLPYRYSGQVLDPRAPTPALDAIWGRVEAACGERLNRYADGREHLTPHADNEPELGRNPVIAGISLGATRRFALRRRKGSRVRTLWLRPGQLFVMGGTCQHTWLHGLPPAGEDVGERINVTFRFLHGPPGWRAPGDPRGDR